MQRTWYRPCRPYACCFSLHELCSANFEVFVLMVSSIPSSSHTPVSSSMRFLRSGWKGGMETTYFRHVFCNISLCISCLDMGLYISSYLLQQVASTMMTAYRTDLRVYQNIIRSHFIVTFFSLLLLGFILGLWTF